MPKHLNRPSNAPPPYPWKDYVESLERKINKLQAEVDKATAKIQQPSLFGGEGPDTTASRISQEPPEPQGKIAEDFAANDLGGFTADSATSRQAAILNYPKSGLHRHRILMNVFRSGSHGKTFDEVRNEESIYGADRRMSELVDAGWLERTERTRRTVHGAEANVMVCSPKAVQEIQVREPMLYSQVTAR
jgi:hypothetical protein